MSIASGRDLVDIRVVVRANFERGDPVTYTARTLHLPNRTVREIESLLGLRRRSLAGRRFAALARARARASAAEQCTNPQAPAEPPSLLEAA